MTAFEKAFRGAQSALGMLHYSISFKPGKLRGIYADNTIDPEGCVATVRYDQERCERDGEIESTAIHEAIHLLTADLMHAIESGSKAIRIEEERLVRRLEPIVIEGLKARSKNESHRAPEDSLLGD